MQTGLVNTDFGMLLILDDHHIIVAIPEDKRGGARETMEFVTELKKFLGEPHPDLLVVFGELSYVSLAEYKPLTDLIDARIEAASSAFAKELKTAFEKAARDAIYTRPL